MTGEPEVARTEDEWLDFCQEAFHEITGDTQQFVSESRPVEIHFRDSKDRWVEARLIYQGGGRIFLQENMGDPLALLELRKRFMAEGVTVTGLGINDQTRASDEVRHALENPE